MQRNGARALQWGQDGALPKISPICRSAMQWLDRRTTHAPIERSAAKRSPCCTASSSQITIFSAEFLAELVQELCRNSAGRGRSALPGSIQVLKDAAEGSEAARSASAVIRNVSMSVLENESKYDC